MVPAMAQAYIYRVVVLTSVWVLSILSCVESLGQDFQVQRGWETQNVSDFTLFVDEYTPANYYGFYYFGEGEGEWTLTILQDGKKIKANYSYTPYDTKRNVWLPSVTKTIKNVRVTGFVLEGDGFLGTFVMEKTTGTKALVLVKGHDVQKPTVGLNR